MSEGHSFGSNYPCCSQRRKISVGVLVDSPNDMKAKEITQAVKRIAENTTSGKENLVEDGARHAPTTEKIAKNLQNDASPLVSTKSFNTKLPSSVAVHDAKLAQNFPVAMKTLSRTKRSKKASVDHSMQPLGCERFGLQSYKERVNSIGKISSALEAGKVSNAENVENLSSKSGFLPEKDLAEDKNRKAEPGGSETLRMKLWEIIGNVSSLDKRSPNVQPIKIDAKDFNQELEEDGKENPNKKANPHSDTIESDSERPDRILRIPLTRSLTRKKASTRKQHSKIEATKITSHKKQCQEKSKVSVRGDSYRRPCEAVDTGFLPCNSLRNKGEEENFENPEERWQSCNKSKSILSLQTSILQVNKAENGHSSSDRTKDILREVESGTKLRNSFEFPNNVMTERPSAAENGDSSNDRRRDILREIESGTKIRNSFESPNNVMTEQPSAAENGHSSNDRRRDRLREIENGTKIRNSFESRNNVMIEQRNDAENGHSSNDRRRDLLREIESVTTIRNFFESPNNVMTTQPSAVAPLRVVETPIFKIHQEDMMNSLLKNKRDSTHNPQSRTFEIKSPVSPECSPFGLQEKDHDLSNAEKNINAERIAKILLNSKSTGSKSNEQRIKNECGGLNDHPPLQPTFVMEQDGEHSISGSSNAATDSDNSDDDFHIKGCRKLEPLSPEIGITKHFLRSRRLCNKKGVDATGCSPKSESLKVSSPLRKETGNEERGKNQMCMEQDQDGFSSAVALLTVALDRVQTKIKSMTEKRSADILMEAAEGIYLQLEHAKSQMEKNVEKLINHSKLKRRRLDAKYQEQHEQLVGIRKRFEAEVEQHLQGYEHLIEDLEEFGTELEGNMKRHKASNDKFLYLAEQAINGQLDDAERKILASQELAREKMLQLKLVVAKCIKQGAFGEIL